MWRDICLDNRAEVLAALDLFLLETGRLRAMIEAGDGDGIAEEFTAARIVRRSLAPAPAPARPAPGDTDGKRPRP
jgi:prephenate dehydrogenase